MNTLAYYCVEFITAVKSFMIQATVPHIDCLFEKRGTTCYANVDVLFCFVSHLLSILGHFIHRFQVFGTEENV